MDADFMSTHLLLGSTYLAKGMAQEALNQNMAVLRGVGLGTIADAGERAFVESGLKGALRVMAEELPKRSFPCRSLKRDLAALWVRLGDHDKAMARLEEAYQNRKREIPMIGAMPEFEPLHSDRRFQDLLRRMGLKPA
jgi:hypothetical protein